jgi:hypothetical protein
MKPFYCPGIAMRLQSDSMALRSIRGGPLEIPGGGVKIPKKEFVQRKMPGKKIRAAITSEEKKSCKQTAKCK